MFKVIKIRFLKFSKFRKPKALCFMSLMRLLVVSDFELELSKQIDERVYLIVHFVAESFHDKSLYDTSVFVKSNIVGTHNLLVLARKYDIRFHHI